MAYRLELPAPSKIHNVFHISLLKKCFGDPNTQQVSLPPDSMGSQPLISPEQILGFQKILQQCHFVPQVLVHWHSQTPAEATWETLADFKRDFPDFNFEDKVVIEPRL